jgi:acyl transferase domain-containing protein
MPKSAVNESQGVAIIGVACRFPEADSPDAFWRNLLEGRCSIGEIPATRWNWRDHWGDPQREENKSNSKWGSFLADVDKFDASFFGISRTEAQHMDPQQRVMLELCWACFEDACVVPRRLSGTRVGVYVGVFNHDYKELLEQGARNIYAHHATGSAAAVVANRISHAFDLRGPSFVVDTACSSSLYALHQAVQAVARGEVEQALAGGINLLLTPTRHISFSKTGMLSPTGRCHSFDEKADGYVRGEGAAVVLLKPLARAREDGDRIYGIVRGSSVNHGGKSRTLTYPSFDAQAQVIHDAWASANLGASDVDYVEAHGTGTPKGDPIEWRGLVSAYQQLSTQSEQARRCPVGTLKSNVGHLEAAAGIAGVVKVLWALQHGQLPGIAGFSRANPKLPLEDAPFYPLASHEPWPSQVGPRGERVPRRAGVSSFGFGGTNAHVVIEEFLCEAPTEPSQARSPSEHVVLLSARNEDRLREQVKNLHRSCSLDPAPRLEELCYTLQVGREAMNHRLAMVVRDLDDLRRALQGYLDGEQPELAAVWHADVKKSRSLLQDLLSGEESALSVDALIADKDWGKLAQLWPAGLDVDWRLLYDFERPKTMRLPGYPFARERHWFDDEAVELELAPARTMQRLLARDPASPRLFHAALTRSQPFLADHHILGEPTLPAVVYLELALAAALAERTGSRFPAGAELNDVVWTAPIRPPFSPAGLRRGQDKIAEVEICCIGRAGWRL